MGKLCLCFLFLQSNVAPPLPQPEHEVEALARGDGLHRVRQIARADHGEAGVLRDDDEPVTTRKGQLRARKSPAERKVHRDRGVVDVLRRQIIGFRAVLPEGGAGDVEVRVRPDRDGASSGRRRAGARGKLASLYLFTISPGPRSGSPPELERLVGRRRNDAPPVRKHHNALDLR
jgi:hypothetical protein